MTLSLNILFIGDVYKKDNNKLHSKFVCHFQKAMMDLLIQGDLRSRSGTLRKKLECFFISPCVIMISAQMGLRETSLGRNVFLTGLTEIQ